MLLIKLVFISGTCCSTCCDAMETDVLFPVVAVFSLKIDVGMSR